MKKLFFALSVAVFVMFGCGDENSSENTSDDDFIEITSVEPAEVTEGEEVTVSVNFDVRLNSETPHAIYMGFNGNSENPDKYIVERVAVLAGPYEGSESYDIIPGFCT